MSDRLTGWPDWYLAWRAASVCVAVVLGVLPVAARPLTARDVTIKFHQAAPGTPVDFSNQDLSFLDLAGLDFKSANLKNVNLYGADLSSANLKNVDLAGAKLDRATIVRADFSGANLQGATIMAPSVFSTAMIDHADTPKFVDANLRGARIAARLDGTDFRGADLTDARIGPNERGSEAGMAHSSKMMATNFSGATMTGTDMREVDCTFCRFTGAKMGNAKLIHVDLSRADFTGATMTNADLSGSNVDEANFSGVTGFDSVKGLQTVQNLEKSQR